MVRRQLEWAVAHDQLARVRLLVEHGADLESRDDDGHTPLEAAALSGNTAIVEYLRERGAAPHRLAGADAVLAAVMAATARASAASPPRRRRVASPAMADRRAAARGRAAAVELLLELGFDVDAYGRGDVPGADRWQTALHTAAGDGDVALVRLLLAAGADPDLRDARFAGTPLGWARHFGRDATIEILEPLTGPGDRLNGPRPALVSARRATPRTRAAPAPRWLIASFSAPSSSAIVRPSAARRARTPGRSRSRRRRAAPRPCGPRSGPRRAARRRCADRRRRSRRRRPARLPAGTSARSAARGSPRRSRRSPAKRAERTPGAPPSAAAAIPESSAIATRPVAAAADARLARARSRRRSRRSRGRASTAVGERLEPPRPSIRANSASLCGLRRREDHLRGQAAVDRRRLHGACSSRSRSPRARADRRGARARAACARRSPGPRRARRRRSSRRSRRPRPASPRCSRGRAAATPSTMPHEIAATDAGHRRALDHAVGEQPRASPARTRRRRR